jgi:hypothetical protein
MEMLGKNLDYRYTTDTIFGGMKDFKEMELGVQDV